MERNQKEEVQALQDTIYVLEGNGNCLSSMRSVTETIDLKKFSKVFRELRQECFRKN